MWRTPAKRVEMPCSGQRVDALGKKKSLLLVARFAGAQFLRTALRLKLRDIRRIAAMFRAIDILVSDALE